MQQRVEPIPPSVDLAGRGQGEKSQEFRYETRAQWVERASSTLHAQHGQLLFLFFGLGASLRRAVVLQYGIGLETPFQFV